MEKTKKVPEIRFPGFTDDWEQRKCGDMTVELSEYDNFQSGYPLLTSSRNGLMFQNDFRDKTSTDNQETLFSVVPYGKCTYRHMSDDNIFHFNINTITEKGLVSREYPVFDASDNNNLSFLIQYLNSSPEFTRFCTQRKLGGTRTRLYYKNLCQFELYAPSKNEQDRIAEYFEKLDNLITLHQRKCDSIKEYKKGLLQKMFPKRGEKVPEIRFPGFTDDWEQRKLGDVIDKLTGGASIAPDDYVNEGVRTIPKGAVNDTGIADMSGCKIVSDEFFKKNISSKTATGELVTSLRDLVPTAPNMGRIVRIMGDSEEFLMPQGVYSVILKKNTDEDFLIAYSNSPEYRTIISKEKNGSTQVHIRNGEFLNIYVPVPSYDEQKMIGEFIKNLDNLITLHQRKCDSIKEYKKGLLQKMFA